MLNLTKQEKIILIFLSLAFVSGLGVSTYKKSQNKVRLKVQSHELATQRKRADSFIEEQRFVNINSLNTKELSRLPGVGETIAGRIVEYHKNHGPFGSKEELMRVKGIGEKKFSQVKDLITLK